MNNKYDEIASLHAPAAADKMEEKFQAEKRALLTAIADYMYSEGCGCCSNRDEHAEHEAVIGKLLDVPMYPDGSGYNFSLFRTKNK